MSILILSLYHILLFVFHGAKIRIFSHSAKIIFEISILFGRTVAVLPWGHILKPMSKFDKDDDAILYAINGGLQRL